MVPHDLTEFDVFIRNETWDLLIDHDRLLLEYESQSSRWAFPTKNIHKKGEEKIQREKHDSHILRTDCLLRKDVMQI